MSIVHFPHWFGALCDANVPRERCDDRLANCPTCLSRRELILEAARQRAVVKAKEVP